MEIVIVVIGILIAFALQGWAEDVRSRNRAAEAERRIRAEILDNAHDLIERIAVYPCLRARVEALNRGVLTGGPEWRPEVFSAGIRQPVLPIVYPIPTRSSTADAYRSALTDGDLASVTSERRAILARIYRITDRLDILNLEENQLADRLQPLQLVGSPTPQDRGAALQALARLDTINGLARLISDQFLERLRSAGYRLEPAEVREMQSHTWPRNVRYGRERYGSCWNDRAIAAFEPAVVARR